MTRVSGPRFATWNGRSVALRLGLAMVALLSVVTLSGEAVVRLCLPAYGMVFTWIAPEFRLIDLAIAADGADRVVRADVTLDRVVMLGSRVFSPDPRGRAYASTLALNAIQGPMVAMLTAVAWPVRCRAQIAWRLLLVIPVAGSAMLFDAPCVLAAELWKILLDAAATDRWSALVAWKNFLQGGGRHALGIALGAAAVLAVSDRHFPAEAMPAPPSPARKGSGG